MNISRLFKKFKNLTGRLLPVLFSTPELTVRSIAMIGLLVLAGYMSPLIADYSSLLTKLQFKTNGIANSAFIELLTLFCLWKAFDYLRYFIMDLVFFPVINRTITLYNFSVLQTLYHTTFEERQKLEKGKLVSATKRISPSLRRFYKECILQLLSRVVTFVSLLASFAFYAPLQSTLILLSGVILVVAVALLRMLKYLSKRSTSWHASDKNTTESLESLFTADLNRPEEHKQYELNRMLDLYKGEEAKWHTTQKEKNISQIIVLSLLVFVLYSVLLSLTYNLQDPKLWQQAKVTLLSLLMKARYIVSNLRFSLEVVVDMEKAEKIIESLPKAEKYEAKPLPSSGGLALKNVSYVYPDGRVGVKDIDISIPMNRTTVIYGANGSGKSTLLRLVAGILSPTEGGVTINGEDARHYNSHMGFLHQQNSLFHNKLGTYFAPILNENNSALFGSLVRDMGLVEVVAKDYIGEYGANLSGGQRQKLCWIYEILRAPPILLLDEPSNHIDATMLASIERYLTDEHGRRTIVIASHSKELNIPIDLRYDLNALALQNVV